MEITSFDPQSLSLDEGFRDLSSPFIEDPAEGLTGDGHLFCGLLLVKAFEIGEADRLELVYGEDDFIHRGEGDPPGFKVVSFR